MEVSFINLVEALYEIDRTTRIIKAANKYAVNQATAPLVEAYKANLTAHIGSHPAVMRDKATGELVPRSMRLFQSPTKRVWAFPDGNGHAGIVGPKSNTAPHAHLVEKGTVVRFRKKIAGKYQIVEIKIQASGTNFRGLRPPEARRSGQMIGTHPLQRAFDSAISAAQSVYTKAFATRLEQRGIAV